MTNKYRTRKQEDEDRIKALDRMKSLGQLDQEYPNEKAALEEYRNRIHEIMGDESIDMIVSELEGYHSTVVPSKEMLCTKTIPLILAGFIQRSVIEGFLKQ